MAPDLMLDFDGPLPRGWEQRLAWTCWQVRVRVAAWWVRRSSGGKGYHVGILLTRRVAPWKAVALQACLGSDWRREVFNVAKISRVANRREPWNVLYTRKVVVPCR